MKNVLRVNISGTTTVRVVNGSVILGVTALNGEVVLWLSSPVWAEDRLSRDRTFMLIPSGCSIVDYLAHIATVACEYPEPSPTQAVVTSITGAQISVPVMDYNRKRPSMVWHVCEDLSGGLKLGSPELEEFKEDLSDRLTALNPYPDIIL